MTALINEGGMLTDSLVGALGRGSREYSLRVTNPHAAQDFAG